MMLKIVVELVACWPGRFQRLWNGHLWMAALHYLMWCLWRERNNWSFEDIERTMPNLKLLFFITFLDWLSVLHNRSLWFVIDLIDLCNLYD